VEFLTLVWLVTMPVWAGVGAFVAHARHRPLAEGIALGVLLGVIGVLIEALLPDPTAGPAQPRPSAAEDWAIVEEARRQRRAGGRESHPGNTK
jgi:hypothetical protein